MLKFIGILAVILGHIVSPFGEFIFSWHMPLFFIISGFFIKFDLGFKEFLVKDFYRLMIPALFFSRLILFYIKYISSNVLTQLVAVLILFILSFFVQLPFGLDNALNAILYVFIGNIYFNVYKESKFLYILPIFLFIIYYIFGMPYLNMAIKDYSNVIINVLWSISIIYVLIILLNKVNISNKLFKIWGGNTMLLFIAHPYTNNIAYIVSEKLYFGDWYLKLLISLALLQMILLIKVKFENKGIFKYV